MANVAGNAVSVIGLATSAAVVADILLKERQKQRLADLSLRAWYYIDLAKGRSMLAWINRNKSKRYLILVAALLVSLFTIWAMVKRNDRQDSSLINAYGTLLVIAIPSCLIGFVAFIGILKAATPLGALVRASIWLALFLIPVISVFTFADRYKYTLLPVTEHLTLIQMLFVIAFVFSILSTVILVIFWTVAALPVALIYLAIVSLTMAEFSARRIAENSRGPLVAMAAFVTLAGAWLRFF